MTNKSKDLIEGKCEVNSIISIILYDSGTTYSFISYDCANRLRLPIIDLPHVLEVSTPVVKHVRTSHAFLQCHFKIADGYSLADLIYLPLSSLDIIFGMNGLLANCIMLNRSDKISIFPPLSYEVKKLASLYLCSLESKMVGVRVRDTFFL